MTSLADRIEALQGPDREVDLDIWWERKANRGSANQPMPEDYRQSNLRMNDAPRYTASLDAAMTIGFDDWARADALCSAMQSLGNPDYMKDGTWLRLLPIRFLAACIRAQETTDKGQDNGG